MLTLFVANLFTEARETGLRDRFAAIMTPYSQHDAGAQRLSTCRGQR